MIGPAISKAYQSEEIKQKVYRISLSDRLRQPGDDDGPWAPDRGEDDPFEGVGSQRSIRFAEEERKGLSYLESLCLEGGGFGG